MMVFKKQKTYFVRLTGTATVNANTVVQAHTATEARSKAIELAKSNDVGWFNIRVDQSSVEAETNEV